MDHRLAFGGCALIKGLAENKILKECGRIIQDPALLRRVFMSSLPGCKNFLQLLL